MTTANGYSPSGGELAVTVSAANVAAIADFVTAETIILKGALRKVERTNNPAYTRQSLAVTDGGHVTTISQTLDDGGEDWMITLIDDYHKGQAGEFGTDLLSAVEIFMLFMENTEELGGLTVTPAGGSTGHIETTFQNPIRVMSVSEPIIDADTAEPAVVQVMISCNGSTKAAHA